MLFKLNTLTKLYTLPMNLMAGGELFNNEAAIRHLVADMLNNQELVEFFFNKSKLSDEDADKMVDWHLNEIDPRDGEVAPDNSFLKLPLEAQKEIVELVNMKWPGTTFEGLLYPQISLEEFIKLITTGKSKNTYICYCNAYFACLVKNLRARNLISGFAYQKTMCSGGKLWSKTNDDVFPPIPQKELNPKDLSSIGYIVEDNAPYVNILQAVEDIAAKWLPK